MKKILLSTKTLCLCAFVSLLLVQLVHAEGTGAAFLKIGAGARAVGMGSAYTAIANDATGMLWNPGGISQISRPEIALLHTQWIVDANYDYLGYVLPSRLGNFGLSTIYLSQGELEQRDDNRNLTGTFGATDLALALSFSKVLSPKSNVGVNLKVIQQRIESETGTFTDNNDLFFITTTNFFNGFIISNFQIRNENKIKTTIL